MVKMMTVAEAGNQLEPLLIELRNGGDAIGIEEHGHLRAVLVSAEEWRSVLQVKERARRLEAWSGLLQLRDEVRMMNPDLDADTADRLAVELGDEVMSRVVARARLRWNKQSR
jgi:PHD/YefM family antitoxin component YafN of YafNO toxin-antitoxin module